MQNQTKVLPLFCANKTIALLIMGNLSCNDFSKKVLASLSKKGISIVSSIAVPSFEGDKYFQGVAYNLVWNDTGFVRTYSQVNTLALSSWCPESFFSESSKDAE